MADVDLENEVNLANTRQDTKHTDTMHATNVLPSESDCESSASSLEDEEEPDESSQNPIGKIVVKASVIEEKRIAKCDNNIIDEKGINPEKASGSACNVYGENKNKGNKYEARKKKKRCYICGDISHEGKACKMVTDCFICSKKGHLAINCPNKNAEKDLTSRLCLKCGSTGHDMFSCTNDYDSEDLKAIRCYICKKVGHLCCVDRKTEGSAGPSCYLCGESGHLGLVCTKVNKVVAIDPEAFCGKCKGWGHYKSKCPEKTNERPKTRAEKAAARMAKRKARRAPSLTITYPSSIVNLYQSQPSGCWRPLIAGPYDGNPGSNLNHQVAPLPSHQHINYYQLGMQVLDALGHCTRFPHNPHWNYQNGPQVPQISQYQETRNVVPQMGSEIRQPMIQPPRILQPNVNPNYQTGILLPHAQSRVPQNFTILPTQHPDIMQNNPRQPFSQQTVILPPSAGTHGPQQFVSRPTNVMPPYRATQIPQQSASCPTVIMPPYHATQIRQQSVSRPTGIMPPYQTL